MLRRKRIESISNPPIEHEIKQWLKHRQEVLVHYSQLCSTHRSEPEALKVFCQLLMDYLSFGHFKMFEKLAGSFQDHQPNAEGLDEILLNKISATTDIALNFNDKYTDLTSLETLSSDLSYLGENLANRIDWEDKLIRTYSQFYSQI